MKDKDKILGALFGVAIGDALGAPLEFMSASEIKRKHGTVTEMIGGGWLSVEPGEVTDDTQMTLAVAEGILENPKNPYSAIGRRFIEWHDSKPKDIGNCCRAVIAGAKASHASTLDDWLDCAKHVHIKTNGQTAGNGALMRAVYPILYYGEEGLEISDNIGRMTHFHEHSRLSVEVYHKAIASIIYGKEINLQSLLNEIKSATNIKTLEPTGYAPTALIYAFEILKLKSDFESALITIVNNGGDADTIGAIAGGLFGAWYGYSSIPKRWIDTLDRSVAKRLEELADIAMNS